MHKTTLKFSSPHCFCLSDELVAEAWENIFVYLTKILELAKFLEIQYIWETNGIRKWVHQVLLHYKTWSFNSHVPLVLFPLDPFKEYRQISTVLGRRDGKNIIWLFLKKRVGSDDTPLTCSVPIENLSLCLHSCTGSSLYQLKIRLLSGSLIFLRLVWCF